jgi:hypothetical protein
MISAIMTHDSAVLKAREIASQVLAPAVVRDAYAGAIMAPTGDVVREFIGKSLLGMPLF